MNTARATRKPTTTPSTRFSGTDRSREMVGSATFTIVVSMIAMNMATTYTTLTTILRLIRRAGIGSSEQIHKPGTTTTAPSLPASRALARPSGEPADRFRDGAVEGRVGVDHFSQPLHRYRGVHREGEHAQHFPAVRPG